jgi:hypothetical protein
VHQSSDCCQLEIINNMRTIVEHPVGDLPDLAANIGLGARNGFTALPAFATPSSTTAGRSPPLAALDVSGALSGILRGINPVTTRFARPKNAYLICFHIFERFGEKM